MEKNSWLVAQIERLSTSWASPSVEKQAKWIEKKLVNFINPDTIQTKTPTSEFLMSSFLSAASVTVFYLVTLFILTAIVRTFATKAATTSFGDDKLDVLQRFKKEPLMIVACVYNMIQVVLCTYMAARALMVAMDANYSLVCNKFELEDDRMGKVHWVFYMSKVLDMVDTYLIVMRQKWRQLSFLHVYHHASIFFISWMNLRTAYDGDMYFTIVANSSVHVVMYSYYLLKTFNFKIPVFFKKMVTNMQIIQFVAMLSQAIYLFVNECPYPRRLLLIYFAYVTSMLLLFVNFFIVNYLKKSNAKKQKRN